GKTARSRASRSWPSFRDCAMKANNAFSAIHVISVICRFLNFPRKLAPNLGQYTCEQAQLRRNNHRNQPPSLSRISLMKKVLIPNPAPSAMNNSKAAECEGKWHNQAESLPCKL